MQNGETASETSTETASEISKLAQGTLSRMQAVLGLEASHYCDLLPVNRYDEEGELVGGVQGFTAPKESAVSWCTLSIENELEDACRLSVRAWNAPLTGVPHLHAELSCSADDIHIFFDFLPRAPAECAQSINTISNELYEHGDEPQEGLSEAEYRRAGERWWLEAAERWYTLDAREFAESVRYLEGAAPAARFQSEVAFGGPLMVDVVLPRNERNLKCAVAAYSVAVTRWLGWKRGAIDRAASTRRDPADTSGTSGWCHVVGARSLARTTAAYAHDSRVRAHVYSEAVALLEAQVGVPVMSRNVAMGRAVHPAVAGASSRISLSRLGLEGATILAEAGPADDINAWTDEIVFASTDTNTPDRPLRPPPPQPSAASWLDPYREPERGC